MQIQTRAPTIGESIMARAAATRRRFSGIDTPATPAIAEAVCDRAPAARMAEHMREIEATRGSVTEGDLLLKDWTEDEILEHGPEAARIARRASVRRA